MINHLLRKYLVPFAFLFVVALTAPAVSADPLLFSNVVALQNNGTTSIDLFSNPNVILYGSHINFLVDVTGSLPVNGSDTLLITYSEQGSSPVQQSFVIPLFGSVAPPFSLLFNVTPQHPTVQGTLATLTIDLLNSNPDFIIPSGQNSGARVNSQTYSFRVGEPVPEPDAILLFGSGGVGLIAALRRRRKLSSGSSE